jgi:hypothetical protein
MPSPRSARDGMKNSRHYSMPSQRGAEIRGRRYQDGVVFMMSSTRFSVFTKLVSCLLKAQAGERNQSCCGIF